MSALRSADPPLSPANMERLVRGVNVELKGLVLKLDADSMHYQMPSQSMDVPLHLEEESEGHAVFSSPKAGTVTISINAEGLLNHTVTRDDDFDLFYFKRDGTDSGHASASATADGVAFLDSLKTCTPGTFDISAGGLGTAKNTVIGTDAGRCRVRIEHPQVTVLCNYTDETIALLTSAAKYEDARNGVLQGSTSSQESQRVSEECVPE